jgi:hypothetical protein
MNVKNESPMVQTPQRAGTRLAILLTVTVLVLLGIYIGMCASVSGDTVLAKTRIVYPRDAAQSQGWTELSGLTREEVLEEVQLVVMVQEHLKTLL